MKSTALLIIFIFSFNTICIYAQKDSIIITSNQKNNFLKKNILPISLIITGSLVSGSELEKDFQKNTRDLVGNNFKTNVDDYLRYAPILEMYAADAFGIKSKNHWFDQSKNLTISIIISDFITFRLKNWTMKARPKGKEDLQSFPSGHASFAFTNAGVLYQEFKDSSPYLAYSGYAFATATGGLRIANNSHWFSDVIVSAGIGILVTELVYLFDPIIKWNPFKKVKGINLYPKIDKNHYGVYFKKTF